LLVFEHRRTVGIPYDSWSVAVDDKGDISVAKGQRTTGSSKKIDSQKLLTGGVESGFSCFAPFIYDKLLAIKF